MSTPRPEPFRPVAAACAAALVLAGCAAATSTTVRHETRPDQPIAVRALHVAFVETDYRLHGERPYLSSAQVNEQRARLGAAFRQAFPQATREAGVPATVTSLPGSAESRAAIDRWSASRPAGAHALVVTPSGGSAHCSGDRCNFRFGVQMVMVSPDGQRKVWSARMEQPALTPGLTLGTDADYAHFAREMARVLLQDTTAGRSKP